MTTQVVSPKHGKSKVALEAALNEDAPSVAFCEPEPLANRYFSGDMVKIHTKFVVVMDPETRKRFALVQRNGDGTFKVK